MTAETSARHLGENERQRRMAIKVRFAGNSSSAATSVKRRNRARTQHLNQRGAASERETLCQFVGIKPYRKNQCYSLHTFILPLIAGFVIRADN
jgi:hypothetical protein